MWESPDGSEGRKPRRGGQPWTAVHSQVRGSIRACADNGKETEEMQVGSLGGEDSLEKSTAIHSSVLAWRIPWTEEPGPPGYSVCSLYGHKESGTTKAT